MENVEATAKLKVAVQQGQADKLEQILQIEGIDPNSKIGRSITSHTPLTKVIEDGRLDLVNLLLSHPDVNPNTLGSDGFTPLALAIVKSQTDIVRALLDDKRT